MISSMPTMMFRTLVFAALCSLLLVSVVQCLPEGFVSEIVSPKTKAIKGVVVPNLRREDHRAMLLVISKKGRVRVLENPENLDTDDDGYINKEDTIHNNKYSNLILDLSGEGILCTNGERGLTSIAAHPNFLKTGWVYLYYTRWRRGCFEDPVNGPQNVLVRYTMNSATLRLENEQLLIESGILGERVHNGGGMVFGTDGYLYLATGDGGVKKDVQDRQNLHGSLLRLNDDGTVPEDNPYAGNSTLGVPCGMSNGVVPGIIASKEGGENTFCSEIYAWGFRNPIRLTLNEQESNKENILFSISDVGAQRFEELSWGGTNYKEKNYGWPQYEGPCIIDSIDSCPLPPPDSNLVDPFHYYVHTSYENGGCVAGSTFVPDGIWPEEYKYLFVDFMFLKIYNLIEDPDSECRETCYPPTSGYTNETFYESIKEEHENVNEARMIDIFFGPYKNTQALYVIKYGNNDSIMRIRYTGLPPVAVINIENKLEKKGKDTPFSLPTSGSSINDVAQDLSSQIVSLVGQGQAINFDGSGSFDPEGNELSFDWNFGDGENSTANTISPSHVYKVPGEYNVTLVVTDSEDKAHQTFAMVIVGIPPSIDMLSPMEGDLFSMGDVLHFEGEAYDNQGGRIPDHQLTWIVRLHQSDHFYSFLSEISGNDFDLDPAHGPENIAAATTSFLSVILKATDDNGLSTEVMREIQLNTVNVRLTTEPEGLKMIVDDVEVVAPFQIQSWVNFDLPMKIITDQPPHKFKQWSDGNTDASRTFPILHREHNITETVQAKDAVISITAIFCLDHNASCGGMPTSCCSGHCDEKGFCKDELLESMTTKTKPTIENSAMADPALLSPYPRESNVTSQTTPPIDEIEKDRKPRLPDVANSISGEAELNLISSSTNWNEQSTQGESVNNYGLRPSDRWLLGTLILLLLVAPCYLGWKYLKLKRKMEARTKISSPRELQDAVLTPRTIETSPSEENTISTAFIESNTSKTSLCNTGTIWDRIAQETERRAKLRAKYCTASSPRTPETTEARETPSSLTFATSPSTMLTTSIDETLVRLDDLLSKTFSRKLSRNIRRQESNNALSEEGDREIDIMESGDPNTELEEDSEQCNLAPLWLSSNQDSIPGSPLRENKNHNTAVEASNYIAALYALRSVHGDINESQILKLSEVSDNSLLVFQDNDLSLATSATSEGILHASGVSDDRIESGLTGARNGNDNTDF